MRTELGGADSGRGGGGGVLIESSVLGERVGGAGGGAIRGAPVNPKILINSFHLGFQVSFTLYTYLYTLFANRLLFKSKSNFKFSFAIKGLITFLNVLK